MLILDIQELFKECQKCTLLAPPGAEFPQKMAEMEF
jgi:hypothetical protein